LDSIGECRRDPGPACLGGRGSAGRGRGTLRHCGCSVLLSATPQGTEESKGSLSQIERIPPAPDPSGQTRPDTSSEPNGFRNSHDRPPRKFARDTNPVKMSGERFETDDGWENGYATGYFSLFCFFFGRISSG